MNAEDALLKGIKTLTPMLQQHGFSFELRRTGHSSGGEFAWGEFVRDDRKLELHFRHSLGMVRYRVGSVSVSHDSYMSELGASADCRYPGFSDDPTDAFRDLANDLAFAEDFLSGSAAVLRRAAQREALNTAQRDEDDRARYAGDGKKLERLRDSFKHREYAEVVTLAGELVYPQRLTESERRMVEIAKEKLGSGSQSDPLL